MIQIVLYYVLGFTDFLANFIGLFKVFYLLWSALIFKEYLNLICLFLLLWLFNYCENVCVTP
jgi:hypothetical protein